MKQGTSIPRSIRLSRLQHHLYRNPQGLTSRELADLCGVCVRTIQRDLLDLQTELGVPITQSGRRYGLLGGFTLPPVFFSLHEAVALFLVWRLALRQALSKMADVLPSELAGQLQQSIRLLASRPPNLRYIRIFERVATAWTARRQMRIRYRSLQATEAREWVLEPYFVEMTGIGYSSYVIGHAIRQGREGIITFKLDRIEEAHILDSSFQVPEGLDIVGLLSDSWGIIWGEERVVKLRFSPGVTRRVKESVWHPSQTIEDQADGGCVMTLAVGSILEITPWIRSWGPDVEVLEPEELRAQFREWAKQMERIYQT
jgi:proteasome accessory factor B